MEGNSTEVLRAEHNFPSDVTVNTHIVEGSAYDGALDSFALVDIYASGGKGVPNDGYVITVVCCGGVVSFHTTLKNDTSKKFGFLF
jgi:hypothetical protein